MTDPYRILVTGSRTWDDYDVVRAALAVAIYQKVPAVIVHGACPSGADAIASWWVRQMGRSLELAEERHPAAWATHDADCPPWHDGKHRCERAGLRRNAHMVDLGASLCLAFLDPCVKPTCRKPEPHGSHGASYTADLAEKAGIPTRRWTP